MRFVAAVSILLALTGAAGAEQPDARQIYSEGVVAFSAGRYEDAAHLFEQAYALSHEPKLLWNLAQAYRHQYDIDHDVSHLRRASSVFANYAEIASTPAERADAEKARSEADREIAAVEARNAAAQAAAARPVVVAAPERRRSRLPGYVLLGVGGGLGVMGLGFGLGARAEADAVTRAASVTSPPPFSTVADHESRGQAYQVLSYVCYGLAGAAVVAGVVLTAIPVSSRRNARAWIAPTAGGAIVRGEF